MKGYQVIKVFLWWMLYSGSWETSCVERNYLVIKANRNKSEWWRVTFHIWWCSTIVLASSISSSPPSLPSSLPSSLFFLQYVLNWEMHRMPMVHTETNGAYRGGIFIVIVIIVAVAINKFWNFGKAEKYSASFQGLFCLVPGCSWYFLLGLVLLGSWWFLMVPGCFEGPLKGTSST